MTRYNADTITYDDIGNPLTYRDGMTMTWQNGRQLSTIQQNGKTFAYTYDANGRRMSKTVDGVTTEYGYSDDGLLLYLKRGNTTMWFLYDGNGSPTGFTDGSSYLNYVKNMQGDILGIAAPTGDILYTYTYDTWGNVLSVNGTPGAPDPTSTMYAHLNPFLYRGYLYDAETGFYYCNSRYYDPQTGRFLNADGYVSTGQDILGYNMFMYCNNNPIMFTDIVGQRPILSSSLQNETAEQRKISFNYMNQRSRNGAASSYIPSDSRDYNCYAYVFGDDEWKCVGGSPDAVGSFDVDNVAQMVLSDANKDGRQMRIIDSYDSPIGNNEYRVALRTSDEDYHFMVQHNDGSWSHKPGICSTRLIDGANPSVISWDAPIIDMHLYYYFGIVKEIDCVQNYYNSKTIYFAVSK